MRAALLQIKVLLLRKNAPQTASAVAQLAAQAEDCTSCRFYRNEARPTVSLYAEHHLQMMIERSTVDGGALCCNLVGRESLLRSATRIAGW